MANEGLILSLAVQESGRGPRKETFEKESVTIGAGSLADLQVKGENVSDVHAMFDMSRANEIHVMDLGSIAGTFVNGKKVNKQKLEIGDEVKVGDVSIKVVGFGEKVEDAAPPELEVKEQEAEAAKPEAKAEEKAEKKEEPKKAAKEKAPEKAAEEKPEKAEDDAEVEETIAKLSPEEEKAIAAKQAMLDEMKHRKASRTMNYTLDLVPKDHKDPGKNRVLEVREILWDNTLLSMRHLYHETSLTMGESKSCDYFMSHEDLPSSTFTLVKRDAEKAYLYFTDKMEGTFEPNGKSMTLAEAVSKQNLSASGGVYALPIEPGSCATIKFEELKYYFRWVEKEKLEKLPLSKSIDYPITSLMVAAIVIYIVGYIWIKSLPAPEIADILDAPERFAKLILEDVQVEEEPEEPEPELQNQEKAISEEGKIGKEEAQLDKTDGSAKKALDEQAANSAGILNALDQGSESMDSIFGGALDLEKNLGMLEGISGLDMRGSGGLGSRGSGYGGGGSALGIGGLGTRGRGGTGRGGNSAYGIGEGANLNKNNANINIKTGNPSIQGALDKSIIARIISKHHSQIRYCYQKELNKNPKLYGKITVKFTISPAGTVSSSVVQVSTMKNVNVEQCVARTIKRIIFPRPKGGGIVVVTYPFIFKAEGT